MKKTDECRIADALEEIVFRLCRIQEELEKAHMGIAFSLDRRGGVSVVESIEELTRVVKEGRSDT